MTKKTPCVRQVETADARGDWVHWYGSFAFVLTKANLVSVYDVDKPWPECMVVEFVLLLFTMPDPPKTEEALKDYLERRLDRWLERSEA